MLRDYSNMWLHIQDNGCFVQAALQMAKFFGRVTYGTEWISDFPSSNDQMIGFGLENYWDKGVGIQRVDDMWAIRHKPDYFWFPDIYYAGVAEMLRDDLKKKVAASFYGEELEIWREETKKHYESLGLPVIPYDVVYGFPNLRQYIKDHPEVWIKTDGRKRGDFETTFAESYELIEPRLDKWEYRLSAQRNSYKFIIEKNMEGTDKSPVVEIGSETQVVDGRQHKKAMLGIEVKGEAYLGIWGLWSKFPREVTEFNDTIAPTLKKYGYCNFISTEIRVRKEKGENVAYQNDLCARLGHPPNETQMLMIKNAPDIITLAAEGEVVEPETQKKCGGQLNLHSQWADGNTQAVWFNEKLKDNIRLRKLAYIDEKYFIIPKGEGNTGIGCITAEGDSFNDVIKQLKDLCKEVKGDSLERPVVAFDSAEEDIEKLKKMGIDLLAVN
jgi:hypothetical protein